MAGADSLFVPGLTDLQTITGLAKASPLPINVMAGPGASPVAKLDSAGVRHVSVGTAVTQAAYTLANRAATELMTMGTYAELGAAIDFATINNLFHLLTGATSRRLDAPSPGHQPVTGRPGCGTPRPAEAIPLLERTGGVAGSWRLSWRTRSAAGSRTRVCGRR
jgi:hypothetical protein